MRKSPTADLIFGDVDYRLYRNLLADGRAQSWRGDLDALPP